MARTAVLSVVFADFLVSRAPPCSPVEVSLPQSSPLRREWAIVCHAAGAAAVLAGWERPGPRDGPEHARRFEALWTTDPAVVSDAMSIALGLARLHAPELVTDTAADLAPLVEDPVMDRHRTTSLTNRVVAYLDHR